MSKRSDRELVGHLREAIHRISDYTAGLDYAAFVGDSKTQDAVIRNLEILGEAAKGLSDEFRSVHADIPWRSLARTRDRLIHQYFGVNLDIVWQIVSVELPLLEARLPTPAASSEGAG